MSNVSQPKKQVKPISNAELIQRIGNAMFTAEGVRRGLSLDRQAESSHKIKAEEIDAIKQTNSKGFRVIDIDPNQLSRTDYFCCYSQDILINILGQEFNVEAGANRFDNTGASTAGGTVDAYWRTVNLSIPGNFLKIEYLPARIMEPDPSSVIQALSPNSLKTNTEPQNTNTENLATPLASKRAILLDFENPTSSPIIVKNGDCYKTYFSNVFLSFKQMNCRIRITIGYNAEIKSTYEQPQSLHLWDGGGFVRENIAHPVPFCWTDADTSPGYAGIAVGATTVLSRTMINWLALSSIGAPTRDTNLGVSILYLTGFTGISYLQAGVDFVAMTTFELFIAEFDQTTLAITSLKKRIASFNSSIYSVGSANGVAYNTVDGGVNFNEPIRVSLNGGECIAVRFIPAYRSAALTVYCKYQISGYIMGGFKNSAFDTSFKFKEHPYPFDNNTADFPKV